jgi:hypothetical protein
MSAAGAGEVDRSFRLLPSEKVLWQGSPELGVPRDRRWYVASFMFLAIACVVALFAGLLHAAGVPAVRSTTLLACYMAVTGIAIALLPRYSLDPCRYLVSDRHVIWKRGGLRRTLDRKSITYARIHWHRSVPGVGHLELVCAVPFGPLARRQRIVLHDLRAPDRVFALIRDVEPAPFSGYGDVQLTERLDQGERVLWGAGPEGWRLGRSELLTAALGLFVIGAALIYGYRTGSFLVQLEAVGLPVHSAIWLMYFLAMTISFVLILGTGAFLLYSGLWGAREDGSRTEYIVTESRLLIRRGRTELSVDRRRIVDVASAPLSAGLYNAYLILDAPNARALDDSGALSMIEPPRALVAPVLYELRELTMLRQILLERAA